MSKNITRQHITDCFNILSRKYPMDKITVNMIIEESGVSKATFYRYFLDKYDVMNYNYKRVLDEIFSKNACKSWFDLVLSILTFIEKDCNRIKNAFMYFGVNSYAQYVFEYSLNRMNEKCMEKNEHCLSDKEIYTAKFIIYGSVYTVRDWLFNGRPIQKKELAKQIDDAIPDKYKALL